MQAELAEMVPTPPPSPKKNWHDSILFTLQMEANKKEMEELQKSWEEKLAESQKANKASFHALNCCIW